MIELNGIQITPTIFPDNTSQVWKVPKEAFLRKKFDIVWEFQSESEVMHLVQLMDLIRHGRVPRPINLHMPYLPYGRQDKDISLQEDTTFALSSFAKVINMLGFDKVTTLDAHSDVGKSLFYNFESFHPSEEISSAIHELMDGDGSDNVRLAFPDKGAWDRYGKKFNFIKYEDFIIGHKVRNQLTGHIEKFNIEGNPKGKDIIIIDDICDGGMTFKIMSESLMENEAKSVHLYVTHGIFSKGIRTLRDSGIQRVFTSKGEAFLYNTGLGDIVVYKCL